MDLVGLNTYVFVGFVDLVRLVCLLLALLSLTLDLY